MTMLVQQRGFTLVELLLTIAIIAILSSVVMSSLSTARAKANDAAIISSMSNMRSEANIFGSKTNGSTNYTNLCSNATVISIRDMVEIKNGVTDDYCLSDDENWVYASALIKEVDTYFCVDSTGVSETGTVLFAPTVGDLSCADVATP